jgi:hypothetical protein
MKYKNSAHRMYLDDYKENEESEEAEEAEEAEEVEEEEFDEAIKNEGTNIFSNKYRNIKIKNSFAAFFEKVS